jgi:hypothetical protein
MKNVPNHADALSFMARKGREAGGGIDNWIVEVTGKYSTDYQRGRELAEEYLAYFGEYPTNGNMTLLGSIVTDMIAKPDTPKGLNLGFMATISEQVATMAKLRHDLSKMDLPRSPIIDRIDEWRASDKALKQALELKGVDPDDEYDAHSAAETALLIHPCQSLEEVRAKARLILENLDTLGETVETCLVEAGGEPMLNGFLRSLLGEETTLKGGAE